MLISESCSHCSFDVSRLSIESSSSRPIFRCKMWSSSDTWSHRELIHFASTAPKGRWQARDLQPIAADLFDLCSSRRALLCGVPSSCRSMPKAHHTQVGALTGCPTGIITMGCNQHLRAIGQTINHHTRTITRLPVWTQLWCWMERGPFQPMDNSIYKHHRWYQGSSPTKHVTVIQTT